MEQLTIDTAVEQRRLAQVVREHLRNCGEVRPFPAAVTQLLSACQDPNSTADTFEKIISCDPGLSIRLLRMANSPLYGLTHEVSSVAHASSILGTRQLRILALSVAGRSVFSQGSAASEALPDIWNHSLGAASVARLLAEQSWTLDKDGAFLAGIFHDVGKLFLFDVVPDECAMLAKKHSGSDLAAAEKRMFGIDHQAIGLKAAHAWGLPEEIKSAIGYHHHPSAALIHPGNAMLMHLANRLAKMWGIGSAAEEDESILSETSDWISVEIDRIEAQRDVALETYNQMLNWT